MHLLDSDVLYILNNSDIEFRSTITNEKFKNSGLVNFIRIYKFIPDGIKPIKKRRSTMVTKSKVTKAPAKKIVAKKATAKVVAKKAPAKKVAVKKPASKSKK